MAPTLSDRFFAATPDELRSRGVSQRVHGLIDQASLFPHAGIASLTQDWLVLSGYRTLRPDDIVSVEQRFIPEYTRFAAGGVRGGFPSLGFLTRTGAPIILRTVSGESLIVLLGFGRFFGSTKNREWLDALQAFARHDS